MSVAVFLLERTAGAAALCAGGTTMVKVDCEGHSSYGHSVSCTFDVLGLQAMSSSRKQK